MPAFQFSLNKRLRNTGLVGDLAWAMVHQGALQLQDDRHHVVRIAPDQIARVRIGYFDSRRRVYHTRIWQNSLEKPLELVPTTATWPGYHETVYAFASMIAEAHGLDRIETGASKFDALFGPALMLIPTLGALLVAIFVLRNEPWWGRMIVPVVPTLIFAGLLWIGMKRYWPTPVHDMSDLKKQLPPYGTFFSGVPGTTSK